MAKDRDIQHYRGLEADRTSVTPLEGELLYTTDGEKLFVGDGAKAGGNVVGPDGNFALGHRSGTRYSSCQMLINPTSSTTPTNVLFFAPICVGKETTFTKIGIQIATAGTGSARLGIYANGDGEPTDLVVDAGTVSVASTGVKTATISEALLPGWYWVAGVFQAGGTPASIASISSVSHPSIGFANTGGPAVSQGMFQIHLFAALPASATSPMITTLALPILFLEV